MNGLALKECKNKTDRNHRIGDWSGPDDLENSKNWSIKKKWAATFVVSFFTFISPVSSSMVAPVLNKMSTDLGISSKIETQLTLLIFIIA